jgi:hypothetical protein
MTEEHKPRTNVRRTWSLDPEAMQQIDQLAAKNGTTSNNVLEILTDRGRVIQQVQDAGGDADSYAAAGDQTSTFPDMASEIAARKGRRF